jgi:hypothetical protein
MDKAIKNRPTKPHHYPQLARSRGKRQMPKATEKAQDGQGLTAATIIGHPKVDLPATDRATQPPQSAEPRR